jgi:HK97 family phage major capsid protein
MEVFCMNKILDLREKRAKAWEAAKTFLDSKQDSDGRLSAENAATYDKMESEVVALGRDIERLERSREIQTEMSSIVNGQPLIGKPGAPAAQGRAAEPYRAAFWNAMRGRRFVENDLKIGTDESGGYLVPDEFERTLIQALEDQNIFRQLARVIHTASGEHKIPVVISKGTASWVEEEGEIPDSDDGFGQTSLSAFKLGTMIKISDELLNDSVFNLEAYVAQEFARRIGNKEEEAFLVGDGSGKPTGIFADTGGGQIGVTTASSTAITMDEMIDLYHSLKQPYRNRAAFLTNDDTIKAIRKLKTADGQYLW